MSDADTKLLMALGQAQAAIDGAHKARRGQVGRQEYMYADLAAVEEAIGSALRDNGLVITQLPGKNDGVTQELLTIIGHSDGGIIQQMASIPCQATSQGAGSAITYLRRYSLMSILRIITEDDDGKGAMPTYQTTRSSASAPFSESTGASRGGHLAQATLELGAVPVGKALITIEALNDAIKGTEFPGKGMLGMYLKQMNSYQAAPDDLVMSWAAQNPGVNAVELLSAAAQYAINVLPDGGMKQAAQKWLKENQ